jgi:hypothetical protein
MWRSILQVDVDEFMSLYAAVKRGDIAGLGGTSMLAGLTQNAAKLAAGLAGFGGGPQVVRCLGGKKERRNGLGDINEPLPLPVGRAAGAKCCPQSKLAYSALF